MAEGRFPWGQFALVAFLSLMCDAAAGLITPSQSTYVLKVANNDEAFVGYALGLYGLGRTVSSPVLGYWSVRMPYKVVFVASLAIAAVGNIAYAASEDVGIWLLLVSRFVVGFGTGCLGVARAYVAGITDPSTRTTFIGLLSGIQFVGLAVTPGAASLLGSLQFTLFGGFKFDSNTGPGYTLAVVEVLLLLVFLALFRDPTPADVKIERPRALSNTTEGEPLLIDSAARGRMSQSGSMAVGTGAGAGNDDNDDGSDKPLLGGRAISNLSARSGWSADDDNRQVFLSISSHGTIGDDEEEGDPLPRSPSIYEIIDPLDEQELEEAHRGETRRRRSCGKCSCFPWFVYIFCMINFSVKGVMSMLQTVEAGLFFRVWEDSDNDEVSDAGVYLMVIGLCGAMTFFSLRWIGAKFDNRKLLLLGSVMITGGCILLQNYYFGTDLPLTLTQFTAALVCILVIGFPLVQTLTISLFSKLLSRGGVGRQGAMLGLLSSSGSVARIVSPVVTGILLDAGDLSNDNDWDDFGNGYHCVIWGLGLSLIGLYGSIHFVVKTKKSDLEDAPPPPPPPPLLGDGIPTHVGGGNPGRRRISAGDM